MHPLAPDFDDMTDEKLDEKIKTLNSRIVSAYRSGSQAVGQMRMLMDDYQEERRRRDKESLDKLMEQSKEDGNDWDDIIDIG
tara:strand:+ start:5237 stop:5482 length:246 start_codon:yes stop_codon:yes gene_type:complete